MTMASEAITGAENAGTGAGSGAGSGEAPSIRAARIHEFGGPEVLRIDRIEPPAAGPGEILVQVVAVGANPLDYKMRDGSSGLCSAMTLPAVLCREMAGVVTGAGEGVDLEALGMPVGTAVFGARPMDDLRGTAAEVVAMPAEALAPTGVEVVAESTDGAEGAGSAENAAGSEGADGSEGALRELAPFAGLAIAGLTAFAAIEAAHVRPGETVLVHGGSGGAGQMIIPLLVRAGAGRIWATGRAENAVRIAELGATPIPYDDAEWETVIHEGTDGRGVDVVIDTHYFSTFVPSLDQLAEGGRIVSLPSLSDLSPAEERGIEAHIPRITPSRKHLDTLAAGVRRGTLPIEVSEILPLEEIARAQELLESGHTRGKIVLAV